MLAIFINVLAIIAGGFVGSITKRSLNVKYLNALATGMGIAILVMGINVAMTTLYFLSFVWRLVALSVPC